MPISISPLKRDQSKYLYAEKGQAHTCQYFHWPIKHDNRATHAFPIEQELTETPTPILLRIIIKGGRGSRSLRSHMLDIALIRPGALRRKRWHKMNRQITANWLSSWGQTPWRGFLVSLRRRVIVTLWEGGFAKLIYTRKKPYGINSVPILSNLIANGPRRHKQGHVMLYADAIQKNIYTYIIYNTFLYFGTF